MNTPITAEVVPVKPVVRPEFWLVAWPREGMNHRKCLGWHFEDFDTRAGADAEATRHPGSVIFRLLGSAAND